MTFHSQHEEAGQMFKGDQEPQKLDPAASQSWQGSLFPTSWGGKHLFSADHSNGCHLVSKMRCLV